MLTAEVFDAARRSVLCWLATADERGQPNVSPKQIFSPSYRFHPDETTEESQVAAAMRTYGVRPAPPAPDAGGNRRAVGAVAGHGGADQCPGRTESPELA